MKKWEYLVITSPPGDSDKKEQDWLTSMGDDGWELVSAAIIDSSSKYAYYTKYIFKRAL